MADVKLLASQRLTDNADGGGLITSDEVVDGEVNNLFPDISRIDRVHSVVNLRKAAAKADTADTALYSGLHAIILDGPDDPNVSATMFSTDSWSDERQDAKAQMERYLDVSVATRMIPFDRQLAGSRTVLAFQRPEVALPEIGRVYVLTKLPDEAIYQFVRVTNMVHEVQTFTDPTSNADFPARVITLTISEPLQATYPGTLPTRYFTAGTNASLLRSSTASDATHYHTITPLNTDAAIDDLTIKVGSVYAQLIPATSAETAIVDASPEGAQVLVQSGPAVTGAGLVTLSAGLPYYVGIGILPGSVTIRDTHATVASDNGDGTFSGSQGANFTVNYAQGAITYVATDDLFLDYTPAAVVPKASQTTHIPITISNRGFVYPLTLRPIPAPGTLSVSYRALGRWVTMQDDGTGALMGSPGEGGGSINFTSGTATPSLGAQPDIGSSIIFNWGAGSEFEVRTDDVDITNPVVHTTLAAGNCEPGTLTITWTSGAVTKTATDDGEGNLTGDGLGRVVYGTGELFLIPNALPDPTTTFHCVYQSGSVDTELYNPTKSGSTITLTAAHAPVRERSILITYPQTVNVNGLSISTVQQLTDNGAGELVDANGNVKAGSVVNYTTGAIAFDPDFTVVTPVLNYQEFDQRLPARTADPTTGYFSGIAQFGKWPTGASSSSSSIGFVDGSNVTLQYKRDGATDASHTHDVVAPPIVVDLTPTVSSSVVPSGVRFTLGGRTYIDRNGTLYYNISTSTAAGTAGGSINYNTGVATVTSWVGGASATITLKALLTQVHALPLGVVTGRVPGPELRPASFYLQANRFSDGALISATADNNGKIDTADMHGYVDVTTGVFSIAFGHYVLDSSLTSDEKLEPWYSVDAVGGDGYIWRPREAQPGSITYNAVVRTSVPLDPVILGISPVRLPLDGRVQAIRPGDVGILHNTVLTSLDDDQTAGQVNALPRGDIAAVRLMDQDGLVVPESKYTVDYTAGTITMADPLSLVGFVEPLVAAHRIEDSVLVTDVQITGEVTFAQPLTHNYDSADSFFSTALIAPFVGGSVQARYEHIFSQQTWDSSHPNWTDAIIGSGTTPQFNDLDYPIEVLNSDAITEKFALVFTSSTAFNIVAQDLGVIGAGTTSANVSPTNPGTAQPYFVLNHLGFGTGWATGNVIRFNTVGAGMPIWFARTVRSGPATVIDDSFTVEVRWDKDE